MPDAVLRYGDKNSIVPGAHTWGLRVTSAVDIGNAERTDSVWSRLTRASATRPKAVNVSPTSTGKKGILPLPRLFHRATRRARDHSSKWPTLLQYGELAQQARARDDMLRPSPAHTLAARRRQTHVRGLPTRPIRCRSLPRRPRHSPPTTQTPWTLSMRWRR